MSFKHAVFEKHSLILMVAVLLTVSVGGIAQLVPLFFLESTIEKVQGMRPYSPLELAGRQIYIREGCYTCHSQQIRSLRDEVERYGHYSLAAESMYDHPFQWGSKRTGPDLARVGGKYSNEWHVLHLVDPRSVVPESVMPAFPFLMDELDYGLIEETLKTHRAVGAPYSDEMIAAAVADLRTQADPNGGGDVEALLTRYPKAVAADFDGDPARLTEMDALVAYLQMLGTLVDFQAYSASPTIR